MMSAVIDRDRMVRFDATWQELANMRVSDARKVAQGRKAPRVPAKCKPAAEVLTRWMMDGTIAAWSLVEQGRWAVWSTEEAWQGRFAGKDAGAAIYTDDEIRHYTGTAPGKRGKARKVAEPEPAGPSRGELLAALTAIVDAPTMAGMVAAVDKARAMLAAPIEF